MKQNKHDAFKGAEKSLEEAGKATKDARMLLGEIKKGWGEVQQKLAVYMERRHWRYDQFMNDQDWDLLFILILCALAAMLLEKYIPAWLSLVVWAALLGGMIFCVLRRFFRRAY